MSNCEKLLGSEVVYWSVKLLKRTKTNTTHAGLQVEVRLLWVNLHPCCLKTPFKKYIITDLFRDLRFSQVVLVMSFSYQMHCKDRQINCCYCCCCLEKKMSFPSWLSFLLNVKYYKAWFLFDHWRSSVAIAGIKLRLSRLSGIYGGHENCKIDNWFPWYDRSRSQQDQGCSDPQRFTAELAIIPTETIIWKSVLWNFETIPLNPFRTYQRQTRDLFKTLN